MGPNNSGKSLSLREIEEFSRTGPPADRKVIEDIGYDIPDVDMVIDSIKKKSQPPPDNYSLRESEVYLPNYDPINGVNNQRISLRSLRTSIREKKLDQDYIYRKYISFYVIRLDGKTRFKLTESRKSGDLQKKPKNHLQALFQNDEARKKIREHTADALGLYFTIDPTAMQRLRIGMSKRPPADSEEEQSLSDRARTFHSNSTNISELSDGVKAFTGLVSVCMSSDYRIMLIDEPEAFLHPPLAKKLGNIISTLASDRGGNVFAATHSADFLMGCIQSGKEVNIIRLTYKSEKPTSKILKSDQLDTLLKDPLLRSSGVLSALFHNCAIVTEADTDRAFYEEINERLQAIEGDGIDDALFLNAQNKQTICRLISPLREMGIPAVGIVDLDIFKGKNDLKKLLKAAKVPEDLIGSWGQLRGQINRKFKDIGSDPKKDGLSQLEYSDKESAENLLNNLKEYGIFVVPNGELESWLRDLEVPGKGPDWLIAIFDKMGSDPDGPEYIKPKENDVWDFIRDIAKWVDDPNRKGVK